MLSANQVYKICAFLERLQRVCYLGTGGGGGGGGGGGEGRGLSCALHKFISFIKRYHCKLSNI